MADGAQEKDPEGADASVLPVIVVSPVTLHRFPGRDSNSKGK